MKNWLVEIGDFPAMSTTLDIEATPDEERSHYIIKNNRTQRFLKLGKNEYVILSSLDGKTSIQNLYKKFNQADPETLDELIVNFYKLRLLEKDSVSTEKTTRTKRFFGNFSFEKIFKIKVNFGKPDKLISVIYKPLKKFFNRYFCLFTSLILFCGIGGLLFNFTKIVNVFWEEVGNGEIIYVLIPILIVLMLHEFAHGLTTKHYGGMIHEMGFVLFYLRPAFYVNITDSYKFKKWQRMVVYFAGCYLQLVINGFLLLSWYIAGSPLGIGGRLLLSFVGLNMFICLINLFPLIKFDGYWMLTTLLGIDNLRKKSFDFINQILHKNILGIDNKKDMMGTSNLKEKISFLIYGFTGITFTFFFVIYILIESASFLILSFKMIGLAIFAMAILIVIVVALKYILSLSSAAFKNGGMSGAKLLGLTACIIVVAYFLLSSISLSFQLKARYQLTDVGISKIEDCMNVKIFLGKKDLKYVKKGKQVTINIYQNGKHLVYKGMVISETYKKDIFFNATTMLAKINNTDALFKRTLGGLVRIYIGKVKVGQYLQMVFRTLIP